MTNRTKAIFGLSGVFSLGLLCGALAVGLFVRNRVQDRNQLKNAAGFRNFFADELSLTEGQKDSLQAELENAYREMADIRNQVELEYREVFDTLARRMEPVLTASQRQRLAEQKDHLLPKREKVERLANPAPSIREIDRRAAASGASPAETSSVNPVEPNAGKEDSVVEGSGARRTPKNSLNSPQVVEGAVATTGDSILTPDTREEQVPRFVSYLRRKLSLNDDQTVQIQDLVGKAVRRNTWIRENFKDAPLVRARRLRQSFRLFERQVSDLLTEEQLQSYRSMKKWQLLQESRNR